MGQHTDALGTIEKFKAPWETDAGEVDIEKPRLKTYLFNLALDKAKAQDAREEFEAKVTAAETEVTAAKKAQKDAEKKLADSDATGEIGSLTEKVTETTARAEKAEVALLKLTVGIEAGLTPAQSARLQGATEEEVKADAEAIRELFGLKATAADEDDDDEDDEDDEDGELNPLRRAPRRLSAPTEDRDASGEKDYDYDKVVAGFRGNNF